MVVLGPYHPSALSILATSLGLIEKWKLKDPLVSRSDAVLLASPRPILRSAKLRIDRDSRPWANVLYALRHALDHYLTSKQRQQNAHYC
jgi:hypothetical protein